MLLVLTAGCAGEEQAPGDTSLNTALLYFLNDQDHIVPVEMESGAVLTPEMALGYISGEKGRMTAESHGLIAPVSGEMEVVLSFEGMNAEASLIGFDPVNARQEEAVLGCISNTLLSAGAMQVSFTLSGEKVEAMPFGTDVSQPVREIVYIGEEASVNLASPLIMYYIDPDARCLVPIISYTTEKPTVEAVMRQFLYGPPPEHELTNGLPEGANLLSVSIEGTTATLNFSREFENIMEDAELEDLVILAIKKTCANIDGVEEIKLLVENGAYSSANI